MVVELTNIDFMAFKTLLTAGFLALVILLVKIKSLNGRVSI